MTQAPAVIPAPPSGAAEPSSRELASVLATVARLADGNCASTGDAKLTGGDARLRNVRVVLDLTLGWVRSTKSYTGKPPVEASQPCGTVAAVQRHFEVVCGDACRNPATSERVASLLGKASTSALDTYQDGCDLGVLPFRAHHVENCGKCHGHGAVRCPDWSCISGQLSCTACSQTGEATCTDCWGNGSLSHSGRTYTCDRCRGRGRVGMCPNCLGRGFTTCLICKGSGEVGCKRCEATGCFTQVHSTRLQGRVSRTLAFDSDAPSGFKRSCEAVEPMSTLAQSVGTVVRAEASSAAGQARLVLHCQVRHVAADIACHVERFHVDALGPNQAIALMPTFLDGLTCELADDICKAVPKQPGEALSMALRTRLTSDVLAVVGRGAKPDIAGVVRRWSGAVSEAYVEMLTVSLSKAYGRAARSPIRRSWLLASPVIALASILLNAYQFPFRLLQHLPVTARPSAALDVAAVTLAELVTVAPVVLLAWMVAGLAGRRRLRAGVGNLARRGPRQGLWPALGLLLAVASGLAGTALRLDADAMGLPFAPAARPGGRSLAQALGGGALDQVLAPAVARTPTASLSDQKAHSEGTTATRVPARRAGHNRTP